MDIRIATLSTVLFSMTGLLGCQTLANNPSELSRTQIHQASWVTSGDAFGPPDDSVLATNESRVVFFRDEEDGSSDVVRIGLGADNVFQSSLQNKHYSESVLCSGVQTININIGVADKQKVTTYSQKYTFLPQTTIYLQIGNSKSGHAFIRQVSLEDVLNSPERFTRQAHQINRVSSKCNRLDNVDLQQSETLSAADNSDIDAPLYFRLLFDFDSVDVKNENVIKLSKVADMARLFPKRAVILEGHTDDRGPKQYNLTLSQKRADAVKNILINQYGLDAERIASVGYGESRPVDKSGTEKGRQNNRRVDAIVIREESAK
ncbi:hypothetical protein CAP50_05555 [Psychrobacter sp. L7]|uniref:OmpA family protein n=1 Tax=Psychrobacter sp. L7 TaxID=1982756 RepID=UPI000C2A44AE|nr:OmpA family protein [Psychrobacter sp. L7]PJX25019.1 hypothetical protein CAP50_05555 [Psychrobacter sp. L7]